MPSRLILALALALTATPGPAQIVLRTEFQDTQPKFISQGNGKFSGFCLEMMALLEKTSEFRFTHAPAFVPVSRIVEDLKSGQIDVYFGLAKTLQREKDFRFIDELFRTRYELVARRDDPLATATDLKAIRDSGVSVLVLRGSGTANYYQNVLGLPVEAAPSSIEVALRQLKAGNGRLFGYYDLGNRWYLENLGFGNVLTAVPVVLEEDDQWLCVSSQLPSDIATRLTEALTALKKTPEWAALLRKYLS